MRAKRRFYAYLAGGILLFLLFFIQVFLRVEKRNEIGGEALGEKAEEENRKAAKAGDCTLQGGGFPGKEEDSSLRILLKTDDYKDYFHKKIIVAAKEPLRIQGGEEEYILPAGEEAEFCIDSKILEKSEVCISTKREGEEGRIFVKSIQRNGGIPAYPGKLWIEKTKEGLLLVNETGMEQYLCGVVNSEMPQSYPMEALKAQAVCARTYAFHQKDAQALAAYHADMDDSTAYQVYMNQKETKKTSRAVSETMGEVLSYQGELSDIFYFSTSCGATSTASEIWNGAGKRKYLTGKIQEKKEGEHSAEELKEEGRFKEFLEKNPGGKNDEIKTWDSKASWYRWETKLTFGQIEKNLEQKLSECVKKSPENIKVKMKSGTYVSMPVSSVGKVEKVQVEKRGTGGIVTALRITGNEKTIRVSTEFVIRKLLASGEILRADGQLVEGMELLPSAFFYMEEEKDGYHITGGGYGHGTGMSQNGAGRMAEEGKTYKEILSYYFDGCDIITVPHADVFSWNDGK